MSKIGMRSTIFITNLALLSLNHAPFVKPESFSASIRDGGANFDCPTAQCMPAHVIGSLSFQRGKLTIYWHAAERKHQW